MIDSIEIVGNNLYDESRIVKNQKGCVEECKKVSQCNAWTLSDGFCYLKNESGILRPGGVKTISGSKICNTSSGIKIGKRLKIIRR